MKLYLARYAPNPRRIAMLLAEKGVSDLPTVVLDLPKGEHKRPDFLVHSPLAQVPTLVLDDGTALTESRAIATYLDDLYSEPNLMGRTGRERAEIEMWDRRAEFMVAMPMMLWVRHASPHLANLETSQSPVLAEHHRQTAMRGAAWFDSRLADRPFIAGDRFTNADLTVLAGIDFAKMLRWRPGDDMPHLKRWREAMAERPCGQTPP
jgi:glutathione S-transferase